MTFLWNELFYKPIYNLLIFLVDILPDHSLGWAIILLTIIIKTIILIPAQKGIKAQQIMQKIQPELDALRKKYEKDPQTQALKSMELYKKYGVNPFGSCLPLLIQFPILIALFFVCRDGLNPSETQYLYSSLQGFDLTSVERVFWGIDLIHHNAISTYVMPVLVGFLQFLQMYRMNSVQAAKQESVKRTKKSQSDIPEFDMQSMQKNMMYILPVMLVFFATAYPAGLSLYWAVSTLYTIIQQEYALYTSSLSNKTS